MTVLAVERNPNPEKRVSAMTSEQVRDMVAHGDTDAEIGQRFGVNRRTVQGFRARHGIAASRPAGKTRRGAVVADGFVEVAVGEFAPVPTPKTKTKNITVAEFLLDKRRAVCPVCQLKEPVKSLVMDARKKGERQADIIEYLHACHRITVTPRDFSSHVSGRHEQ